MFKKCITWTQNMPRHDKAKTNKGEWVKWRKINSTFTSRKPFFCKYIFN